MKGKNMNKWVSIEQHDIDINIQEILADHGITLITNSIIVCSDYMFFCGYDNDSKVMCFKLLLNTMACTKTTIDFLCRTSTETITIGWFRNKPVQFSHSKYL